MKQKWVLEIQQKIIYYPAGFVDSQCGAHLIIVLTRTLYDKQKLQIMLDENKQRFITDAKTNKFVQIGNGWQK